MKPDVHAVARLPIALDPWEVGLVDVDVRVEDMDVEGVLLVVEGSTGFVRLVTPIAFGASLRTPLLAAMTDPGPQSSSARPRLVGCRDAATRDRVAAALEELGVDVRLARDLPALDEAAAALRHTFGVRVPWPAVTERVYAWRDALHALARRAPWTEVSDVVTFRFEGGPRGLSDAVAALVGRLGEKRGVILFPSEASHARFLAFDDPPTPSDIGALDMRCVHLLPEVEVDPRERRSCAASGFVLPGGLYPHVFSFRDGTRSAVDAAGQAVLLAAVEAVDAMCGDAPGRLEGAWERMEVGTTFGTVRVTATPG